MAGRWVCVLAALVGVCGVRRSTLPEDSLGVIQSLLEKHPGMSTIASDALQKVRSLQQGENLGSWTSGVQAAVQNTFDILQTDVADKISAAHQQLQSDIDKSVEEMKIWVNRTLTLKNIADFKDETWYKCVKQAKLDMANVTLQQRMFNQKTHERQIPCAQEIEMHGSSLLGNSTAQDCFQAVSTLEGFLTHQVDWLVDNGYASKEKCRQATGAQAVQLGMVNLSQSHWVTQNQNCRKDKSARKDAICQTGSAAQATCMKWYEIMRLQVLTMTSNNPQSVADMQHEYSNIQLVKCLLTRYRDANFTEQTMQDCQDKIDSNHSNQLEVDWHADDLKSAIALAQLHGVTCTVTNGVTADQDVIFHGRYWSNQPDNFEPQTYTGAEPSPEDIALETYVQKKNLGLPFTIRGKPFSMCE